MTWAFQVEEDVSKVEKKIVIRMEKLKKIYSWAIVGTLDSFETKDVQKDA